MVKRTFAIEGRDAFYKSRAIEYWVQVRRIQIFGVTIWKWENLH